MQRACTCLGAWPHVHTQSELRPVQQRMAVQQQCLLSAGPSEPYLAGTAAATQGQCMQLSKQGAASDRATGFTPLSLTALCTVQQHLRQHHRQSWPLLVPLAVTTPTQPWQVQLLMSLSQAFVPALMVIAYGIGPYLSRIVWNIAEYERDLFKCSWCDVS